MQVKVLIMPKLLSRSAIYLALGVSCFSFALGLLSMQAQALPEAAGTAAASQTPSVGVGGGVSPQGQVTQSYGFALPPARLMPSLSLSYGSNGGDSDVGYGWNLVSGGRISRDVRREEAVLDARDDHYVVNGVSLLQMSFSGLTTLQFERWGDVGRTQYEFDVASNTWTERTRQGLIRRYRALLQQEGTLAATQDGDVKLRRRSGVKTQAERSIADRTLVWSLAEEEDRDGNRVEYIYRRPSDLPSRAYQPYPSLVEIRYGGNAQTAGAD
jgi:hypothetical protein